MDLMAVRSVSAVLPAYNEERNLARTVGELLPVLERVCADHEAIVVDDGSTDRTGAVADALAAQFAAVRVVHHPRNLGYGGALRTGFAVAALGSLRSRCPTGRGCTAARPAATPGC
jgi:glycosyltransferase involved in cell wall biosynthesis